MTDRETRSDHPLRVVSVNDDEAFSSVLQDRVDSAFDQASENDSAEDSDVSLVEASAKLSSTEIAGVRIALVGRFGSMNRRQATNVLESFQAKVLDLAKLDPSRESPEHGLDWIVIGAEESVIAKEDLLAAAWIDAAARGEVEVILETDLWQRLGLLDAEQSAKRIYTPAMLAELLSVSVQVIRRWHRRGLITPAMTLHRLPFFDYAEVASAKRLAGWIAAGASPKLIEKRLVELVQIFPGVQRPLDQLTILVEGKEVLLRQGDGLIEPGGQMRFDFDAATEVTDEGEPILAFGLPDQPPMLRGVAESVEDELLQRAYAAEDADELKTAIDLYHTILARDGARADVNFQIAELLYRMNCLLAARERYYSAIELDPEFVEARASLGAVLAELGQRELAIAALRGALSLFEDYVDAHYTLAKVFEASGRGDEALPHWKRVSEIAPQSPWAAEANDRLDRSI
ncbi:MAG: tetratricopeptide repeat protein [Planctomycetota bacterium]